MEYIQLHGPADDEMILKFDGSSYYRYVFGGNLWKRTSLMDKFYTNAGAEEYQKYTNVDRDFALEEIDRQSRYIQFALNDAEKLWDDLGNTHKFEQHDYGHLEISLVDLLSVLGKMTMDSNEKKRFESQIRRVLYSVHLIWNNNDLNNDLQVDTLCKRPVTRLVIMRRADEAYANGWITAERYDSLQLLFSGKRAVNA